jgi:hypothetical protein
MDKLLYINNLFQIQKCKKRLNKLYKEHDLHFEPQIASNEYKQSTKWPNLFFPYVDEWVQE